MAKVEIRKNGAGGGGGGTPVVFTSVTYAQLVTMIGASGLTQGSFYLITDFQTIYDQPDFNISGNPKIAVSTLSGSIEPIFVQAVSTNEISNQAISSVYENDELLYDWTFQTTEITGSPAKGLITRRITDNFLNGKRNSTPYDSREVLFKRYESVSGSGIYNSYKDTGFASSNVPTFGINSTDNVIGNFWNNDILSNVTNYPFVLPNTVFGDNSSFNNIGDQCFNITFGDLYCINNNIGNYFFNNLIGDNFQNNTIGNFFANNTIGDNFQSNNIGNFFGITYISGVYNFNPNVIGYDFSSNEIENNFLNNTIGNNFQKNQIGNYFAYNTITNNFQSNKIGNYFGIDSGLSINANNILDNFKYNSIGDSFSLNSISNNFQYNNIGSLFYANNIGLQFDNNDIENYFQNNLIGNYFQKNEIGNSFQNNEIGNYFQNNDIGNSFKNNPSISDFFKFNKIGDYFSYNVSIATTFENNQIGNYFGKNTIGNSFRNNSIGNNFGTNDSFTANGNTIGLSFEHNTIGNFFYFNTIGDYFSNNNIDNFFGTDDSNSNYGNIITDNFYGNNIGLFFYGNTISNYFRNNEIGNYFGNNSVGVYFEGNKVLNYFGSDNAFSNYANTIGNSFSYNNVGTFFYYNNILDDFTSNRIGDYFGTDNTFTNLGNTISTGFRDNVIGDFFYSNNLTIDFYENNIKNYFHDNSTTGSFYKNDIGNNFATNVNIGINFNGNIIGDQFIGNTIGDNVHYLLIEAYFSSQTILSNTNSKTWINNLGTGTVSSTNGFLETTAPLSDYVPYTGATTNVNLGEFGITAGQVTLDTSPTGTPVVASTYWNNSEGVTETLLLGGNVELKNGVDLVARVVNNTGVNVLRSNYQVVKVSGAQGQRLAVDFAQADGDPNSADTLGVVIENINNNLEGFIMTVGEILDINTTGSLQGETWADGDVLYLSTTTAGALTNIKPTALQGHLVVIGYVIYAHNNHGKIYVKIMNGWELDELHNVYINPLTLANNDVLAYDSTAQLWENKTISTIIGGTPVTGSGTANYVTKFTGSGTVGVSSIRDDGSTVSINSAPLGFAKFGVTNTTTSISIYTTNTYIDPAPSLQQENYGAYHTITAANTWYNVGGYFSASGAGTANYSVKLSDGTEAVGKFLKCITADGKANWATLPTFSLTYFTEAQNTSAPNGTVYVNSLTAVSSTANADFAIIPKGTGAILRQIPDGTVTGGNKRGANAIDFQYSRTLNTQVASGTGAVCFGTNNYGVGSKVFCVGNDNNAQGSNSYLFGNSNASTAGYDYGAAFGSSNQVQRRSSFASGTSNIVTSRDGAAFGDGNTVSVDYGFAFGGNNITSGTYSVSIGYQNSASGQNSIALGRNASTGLTRGKLALSSGRAAVNGDVQLGFQVLFNRTTGNTATRLYAESGGNVASTQVYPPINGAYRFKGSIIAKQTGTTNVAAWDIDGIIVKGATDASVVLSMANVTVVQNTPAWGTPTLTADTVTIPGTLNISVTGAVGTNIQWVCSVQTTEVIY